jgi:hypothetical protein
MVSPLMTAVKYGSELVTDLLLGKKNVHVNRRNADGESALWYSVAKESSAVVNQLLQHPRVKIDLPNREGQTVLWLAVFRASRDLVSLLLKRRQSPEYISPWIQACIRDRNWIKYLLLDHINAESLEMFLLAMKTKYIGSSSYGQSQVQLRTKIVKFPHA